MDGCTFPVFWTSSIISLSRGIHFSISSRIQHCYCIKCHTIQYFRCIYIKEVTEILYTFVLFISGSMFQLQAHFQAPIGKFKRSKKVIHILIITSKHQLLGMIYKPKKIFGVLDMYYLSNNWMPFCWLIVELEMNPYLQISMEILLLLFQQWDVVLLINCWTWNESLPTNINGIDTFVINISLLCWCVIN